jgi:hypothetical protein
MLAKYIRRLGFMDICLTSNLALRKSLFFSEKAAGLLNKLSNKSHAEV